MRVRAVCALLVVSVDRGCCLADPVQVDEVSCSFIVLSLFRPFHPPLPEGLEGKRLNTSFWSLCVVDGCLYSARGGGGHNLFACLAQK